VVASIRSDSALSVTMSTADSARAAIRRGDAIVAVTIPPGFGDSAAKALVGNPDKPQLQFDYDPSHLAELGMVRGILTGHVLDAVSRAVFKNGPGLTMPFVIHQQPQTANNTMAYNGYAHAFAGMGIQFLLLAAIDLGIGILLERQRGLWKRLRSAPLSRSALLGGKAVSGTIITLLTLLVSFAFAIVVFKVRIAGSVAGFLLISAACALMAATFGLMIAAVGKTPSATRGVSILGVLLMVMLGGAWIPSFMFPAWVQRITLVVPVRWAVDGLDAMTWRGIGFHGAIAPTLILLAFAGLFAAVAIWQFRWEEA
jgi:ABC-type transport system involved in multi-copper enzyme maturation permease subunit